MARLMDIPLGKPLQVWWESYYNYHDEIIACASCTITWT